MINKIYTYRSPGYRADHNQAVEAQLTFWVPEDACVLYLWQNDRTVVIGRNQNAYEEVRVPALEAEGGFLARRLSGGGAVYHDLQNLNFTFCVRDQNYDLEKQLEVIIQAVSKFGLKANFSGRNDILLDGRKFSGNAFYHSGNFRYHHGTLLINVDGEAMARYLSPPPAKLASKGVKSVRSRVVNLKSLVPDLTPDMLAVAMEEAFAEVYGLTPQKLELADFGAAEAKDLDTKGLSEADKLTNPGAGEWHFAPDTTFAEWLSLFSDPAWRLGRQAAAQLEASKRFDWGFVQAFLSLDGYKIQEATLFSDAMDGDFIALINQKLPGMRLRKEELEQGLKDLTQPEHAKKEQSDLNAAMLKDLVVFLAELI
jgi:lipoate-protein ligase A